MKAYAPAWSEEPRHTSVEVPSDDPTLTVATASVKLRSGGRPAGSALVEAEPLVSSEVRDKVRSLRRGYNWNGCGARAIGEGMCRSALRVIEAVRMSAPTIPYPEITASPRGGITLTWNVPSGFFTVRVVASSMDRLRCEWEGLDYSFGTEECSVEQVVQRLKTGESR